MKYDSTVRRLWDMILQAGGCGTRWHRPEVAGQDSTGRTLWDMIV